MYASATVLNIAKKGLTGAYNNAVGQFGVSLSQFFTGNHHDGHHFRLMGVSTNTALEIVATRPASNTGTTYVALLVNKQLLAHVRLDQVLFNSPNLLTDASAPPI